MTRRFNPPPGWPTPPAGWDPPQDWRPDPAWPPAPTGWQFYVESAPIEDGFDSLVDQSASPSARSWYKKKRFVIPLGFVVLIALASAIPDKPTPATIAIADGAVTSSAEPAAEVRTKAVLPASTPSEIAVATPTVTKSASPRRIAPKPKAKPKPKPKPKPKKTASRECDPNYGGACVPIASDVDCASGSGNGPAYLSEQATVIGNDIYDLDRDGDGLACESE